MKRIDGWGVTGWADQWTALGSDVTDDDPAGGSTLDGYGVQRTVDPGVVYAPPPADVPGVPRWHPKPHSGDRILQMPWPDVDPPVTRSLLELQAAVAGRRRPLPADDPDLAALDAAIDQLVAAAVALHASGRSLGFVQPDSVRHGTRNDGTHYIVLPDVGFAWDNQSGLMMPRWIAQPALPILFDRGAAQRNEECLAEIRRARSDDRSLHQRAADAAAAELADVKILARLIAAALVGAERVAKWCGTKACLAALPPTNVAPETRAEIWDKVIAPALAGHVRTCEELRMRLATYRPSGHFLFVPPAPPWAGWVWLRRGAMVAAAVAAAGLLWMVGDDVIKWVVGEPAPYCRFVTRDDPLYGALVELRQSEVAAQGDVSRRPEFWGRLRNCRVAHSDPAICGRTCLDGLVADWLAQTEEEGRALRERLRSRPRPTAEEVRKLQAAVAAIEEATAAAKQTDAPDVVRVLVRELTLRGGPRLDAPPNDR